MSVEVAAYSITTFANLVLYQPRAQCNVDIVQLPRKVPRLMKHHFKKHARV